MYVSLPEGLHVGSSTSMLVIRPVSSFTSSSVLLLLYYLICKFVCSFVRLFERAVSQSVARFDLVGLSPNFPVLCSVSASVLAHKI